MKKRTEQARVRTVEGSPFHIGRVLRWVMIAVWLVFLLLPLYWVAVASIKPQEDLLTSPPVWWPHNPTSIHYDQALNKFNGWKGLKNSLLIAFTTTIFAVIIGTAGDRPDDTLRGIGRLAAERADRVAIKETLGYLRGRDREEIVRVLRVGIAEGGMDASAVPVYETEPEALEAELVGAGAATASDGRPDAPRVLVLFCHEARDEVFALLERLGARPLT